MGGLEQSAFLQGVASVQLYTDCAVCGLCNSACVGRAGQRSLGYSLRNLNSSSSGNPSNPVLSCLSEHTSPPCKGHLGL